jgi:hypothetical protein
VPLISDRNSILELLAQTRHRLARCGSRPGMSGRLKSLSLKQDAAAHVSGWLMEELAPFQRGSARTSYSSETPSVPSSTPPRRIRTAPRPFLAALTVYPTPERTPPGWPVSD